MHSVDKILRGGEGMLKNELGVFLVDTGEVRAARGRRSGGE